MARWRTASTGALARRGLMLIRRDQIRKMLALIHEAREIGAGLEQKLHLVAGIDRILGAAMTTIAVLRHIGDPRRRTVEHEVSTPSDRNVRTMIEALRTNSHISGGLQAMSRLLRAKPMVTARRCEFLPDKDWYLSESYNLLHRICGFDDHVYSFRAVGGGRVIAIALRRPVGDRPYVEEEQNLLELFHEELVRLEPTQRSDGIGPRLALREREVLQGLLRGASEKEVAFELNLSPHTVHSYAKSIYSAYDVSSRAELLVRCLAR